MVGNAFELPMPIHADLDRHVREVFLPSLPEPHRETARILFEQIRKLEDIRAQSLTWSTADQSTAHEECRRQLAEVAGEVREAYKQVIHIAHQKLEYPPGQ